MRDANRPSPGPEGPASPHPAQQPPGQRSGEGSESVLELMLKDTSRKAADAASQQRAQPHPEQDAQAAR